ncbi:hypothetical protein D5R81_19110 [Parashewanella spongiae]|uniref:HEAT repeat domain-containing protein n=1 Tax=Parashewanella spongiae TaxID=342950 RepID=A0A3A6T9G6_9GAMM|nr:hypothetical protein [Parashewanella spongiae]MCL1080165.1 hypothetical protein [Parashewanella spongiae]RJY04869.1 hypothetical protein D5R81_19110 [Parashewanella spongiae]
MQFKQFLKLKSSLVIISLLFCAQSSATEIKQKPWHFDSNIYRELIQNSDDEMLLNKNIQWDECSRMAPATYRMALGVQLNKESPDLIRETILDLYPVDNESFSDVVNQKIMVLAFEMADVARYEQGSDESTITQVAWDWCIAQDPQNFSDL